VTFKRGNEKVDRLQVQPLGERRDLDVLPDASTDRIDDRRRNRRTANRTIDAHLPDATEQTTEPGPSPAGPALNGEPRPDHVTSRTSRPEQGARTCGYDRRMCALLAVTASGAGEPLVMLHGLATDGRIWSMVVPRLARRRRVITVDVPGFGASAAVDEDFRLEAVAQRIARGLAAQGVSGPYDLVGHSLGGGIALTLADLHPRLVRRLVLVAPAGLQPLPASLSSLLAATVNALLAVRREAAPLADRPWGRRLLLLGAAADGASLPPELARRLVVASATARRTAPAIQTITASDLRPLVERLRAPLGVIWGQGDRALPLKQLTSIRELAPDALVVELRDAGHVPMVERPAAFVDALEGLLDELPTSPRQTRRGLLNNDTIPSAHRSTVL